MNQDDVEIIDRKICYEGFFRIESYKLRHRLFRGSWSDTITRELFERGHAVAVLPYDPHRDEVVLIEQFRIGALIAGLEPWLWEIVAGVIEADESVENVARREAIEESGCTITDLLPVCQYLVSPGGTSEQITVFCGRTDASEANGIHGIAAEGEDIRAAAYPFTEAVAMVQSGRINSASPIIALQWLSLNKDYVIRQWR